MTEIERIADQLQRAYSGPAWHGPSVMEALEGVTAEIATRKPIPNAHSIWELVHHISGWADIARRRFLGEKFEITDELNFPPVPATTEAAWQESLRKLAENQSKLVQVVRTLPEDTFDQQVVTDGPTRYMVLHGMVQHHIYHAGQIVLLKK